jgi:hypothetical protein
MILSREYWMIYMIYIGPGFLAVVIFGFSPTPSPLFRQQVASSFSQSSWTSLLTGGRGRGWGRSQIIQQLESLVLYKSFNTLWYYPLTAEDSAQALPLTYVRLFFSELVIVCGWGTVPDRSLIWTAMNGLDGGVSLQMMNRDYWTINM